MSSVGVAPQSIMLAVPTRGEIHWTTITALQAIRDTRKHVPPIVFQPGHLSVANTRNKIVRRFLESDAKVLIMVDDDVVAPLRLLELADHAHGWGMIAVPTPVFYTQNGVFWNCWDENRQPLRKTSSGIRAVHGIGTAVSVIHRMVLEKMPNDPFFVSMDDEGEVSDDVNFCNMLRDQHHRIGCCWDMWADHVTRTQLILFHPNR